MKWNIHPFTSVGPIEFGKQRNDIRKHFQEEPKVYAQSEAVVPHDTYEDLGLFVMYDKYNRCAAVEFIKPHTLLWEGENLFENSFHDVLRIFYSQDPSVVVSAKDFTSFNLGVSVFAPDKDNNPNAKTASITVFRKDHFNQKIGIADPSVFSTFLLQTSPSQWNPIGSYSSLKQLWQNAFANSNDFLLMYWNSQPVAISYSEIHALAPTWLLLLNDLREREQGRETYQLQSNSVEATWTVQWDEDYIAIDSAWAKACGMESALNHWGELKVLKSDFINEWSVLLHQLSQGLHSLNAKSQKGADGILLEILLTLHENANLPGRWYRKDTQALTKYFEPN